MKTARNVGYDRKIIMKYKNQPGINKALMRYEIFIHCYLMRNVFDYD